MQRRATFSIGDAAPYSGTASLLNLVAPRGREHRFVLLCTVLPSACACACLFICFGCYPTKFSLSFTLSLSFSAEQNPASAKKNPLQTGYLRSELSGGEVCGGEEGSFLVASGCTSAAAQINDRCNQCFRRVMSCCCCCCSCNRASEMSVCFLSLVFLFLCVC